MSRSFQLSEEHHRFCSLMKCPQCNQFPIVPTYFQQDGTRIRQNISISEMDVSTVAECPRCRQRWSVFNSNSHQGRNPDSYQQSNTPPTRTYSRDVLNISSFEIIEANREEESLGSDRRTIDNSRGSSKILRKLTLTKEWSKTYTVDFEKAVKAYGDVSLNLPISKLLSFKTSIEGNLRKKYSISENIRNIYTDEISVEIEPQSKETYCFNWKRIFQNGTIKCLDKVGREVAFIPFKVMVDISFDIVTE